MRKILLSFLLLVFVAFSINAQITNGGFESWSGTNPDSWFGSKSATSGLTVTKVTTGTHGGTNACGLKNTQTGTSHRRFTSTATSVSNGTTYHISFWLKGTGQVRTGMYTGINGTSYGYLAYNAYVVASSTWTQYTQDLTSDGDVSVAEFIFSVYDGSDLMIDDVEVSGGTLSNQANITGFTIPEQFANATIDTTAKIVTLEVINGTALTALVPTITTSGGATISPASGVAQDFTSSVTYTVTAQNGTSTKIWTATVTVSSALSSAAEITGFSLPEQISSPTINSTNGTILVTVGTGTSLTALTPTITLSAAATVSPASGVAQDFTDTVTYTVTAQNSSTKIWKVKVTELQTTSIYDIQYTTDQSGDSPLKDQTVTTSGIVTGKYSGGYYIQDGEGAWNGIFIFDNVNNPSLGDNVTITGLVTEYFKLTEIKTITSYTVNSSSNILPNPTIVTASQVNTENYEGVLIKLLFGECTSLPDGYKVWGLTDNTGTTKSDDILFSFTPTLNTFYDVVGIGDYSFDNYKILPRSASDISISVKNTEANIVSFYLAEQTGVAVIDTTAKTVSIEVFTGTNVTALVPTIIVSSAATISPASGISQDFTSAKTYTVTAQNTSFTKIWTVTVSVSTIQSSQAEILTFTFPSDTQAGASVINSTNGTVTIEVFPDVNRTNLTPTITNSVFSSISPASGVAKDFSVAQTYVVTAQDGTTKTWTVTVTNQTFTTIYEIQYTTAVPAVSPKNDQKVTVKGIVTATGADYYQGVTTSFYHIQEAAGAWNSIKILQENHGFSRGDSIIVTGTVDEDYNINTDIENITSTKLLATFKNFSPTYVTIAEADSEAFESVLVTIFAARCSNIVLPYEFTVNNGGDSITVSDVIYSEAETVVEKNKYYQVTGVMAHSFSEYRIYPRDANDIVFVEGIEDLNNKNNLQVYPNPVTNKVTISNNSDIQKITLFNILGSKVLEVGPFKSNLIDLDLRNLDKGIYMLNIQYSEKYSETVKIVKQ